MASTSSVYGGIEAGGTKFVCLVGSGPERVDAHCRFETGSPRETLERAIDFFAPYQKRLAAVGVGSFGPVDLHLESPTWGYITDTPKPGWQHVDFAGQVGRALGVPIAFDTDVNAAALGEMTWGGAQGVDNCLYITVGTGVGGGAFVGGRALHGLVHPEMGHVRVPRAPNDDFPGACPFHGDCLEGMVSGPALRARTGRPGKELEDDDPAWRFVVHYLSHAILNFIYTLSPERIVLGGGVSQREHLIPRIRSQVQALLNGYVDCASIIPPALGERSGALGALAMAMAEVPLYNPM